MNALILKIRAWPLLPTAGSALILALISLFFSAVVFGVLLSIILLLYIREQARKHESMLSYRLLLVGFLIRFPIISLLGILSHLKGSEVTIFGDSRLVLLVSRNAMMAFMGSFGSIDNTHLIPGFYGYSAINWFFGAVYYLFGYSPFLAMLINVLAILLAGWLIFLITYRITGHHGVSCMALGFTVLMPSQIMWSINLLKEPIITLYLALFIYLFVDMISRRRWWYLLILVGMCLPLGHLRTNTNQLALATLLISSLLFIPRRMWPGLAVMTAGAAALAIKLGPARIVEFVRSAQTLIVSYQNGYISTGGSFYVYIPHRLAYGGSGGGPMTAGETITTLFKALYYYLTSPSLLGGLNPLKVAVAPQVVLWLVMLVLFFIPGALYLWHYHRRSSGIVLVYLIVFTSALALFTGNEGAAFRQRDTLTPFFFIPISVGFFNVTGWLSHKYRAFAIARGHPQALNPEKA